MDEVLKKLLSDLTLAELMGLQEAVKLKIEDRTEVRKLAARLIAAV